jgi:hypothetical protein
VASELQSEAEQLALLERYLPQLRYDAQEPYRTMGADSICENPGNHLARNDGAVIARAGGEGDAGLSVDLLSGYPGGLHAAADDRLDEAADVLGDARRLQGDQRYRDRVYGRTLTREGRIWLQYWFWLYYNPKHLLGFGRHEGDWEMIQLGLDGQGEPELVTYAQHDRGERKLFSEIEHHEDAEGLHPVVYVAPFSHASYFEAGTHFYLGGTDNPDGGIVPPLPRVVAFGDWEDWIGLWGNSRGVLWRLSGKLGGRSPRSPGQQGAKWNEPEAFHESSRERPPRQERLSWRLGAKTYPRQPRIEARVEGQSVVVDYALDPGLWRQPTQLLLTVHDAKQPGEPVLVSRAVHPTAPTGSVPILVPAVPEQTLVRASAFNRLRQRSDVSATTAV